MLQLRLSILILLTTFNLSAQYAAEVVRIDQMKVDTTDTQFINFNIYIDYKGKDLAYPTIAVVDAVSKKAYYVQDLNYYIYPGPKLPFSISLPRDFIFKKRHEILLQSGQYEEGKTLTIVLNNKIVRKTFNEFASK